MMAKMAGWESRQIDSVLVFSQSPVDGDVYHHFTAGFHEYGEGKK